MEMPDDDRPPEAIWLDDEALSDHFARVREKYSSGGAGGGYESVPQADDQVTENALAKAIRAGR
jgi:hypothetical protein